MNVQFLASLIKANNRLVIPNLGAFLHKETGSIVFSPFLNKDDGMLQSAISRHFGVPAHQANQEVETLVETIKSSLSSVGKFYIDNVGILMINETGGVSLVEEVSQPTYVAPVVASDPVIPSIDPLLSRGATSRVPISQPSQPASQPESGYVQPQPIARPSAPRPQTMPQTMPTASPIGQPTMQPLPQPVQQPTPQPVRPAVAQPIGQPITRPVASRPPQPNWVPPTQPGQQTPPQPQRPQQMRQSGINLQGAPKGAQQTGVRPRPNPQNRPPQKPNNAPKRPQQKGKNSVDVWLVVAIIAAILVVILIVYGLIYTDPTKQMF